MLYRAWLAIPLTLAVWACAGGSNEREPTAGEVSGAESEADGGATATAAPAPAPAPAKKTCSGRPTDCSSLSPPNCEQVYGCSMDMDYRGSTSTFDDYCDGNPDSCESQDNEKDCTDQGCEWK